MEYTHIIFNYVLVMMNLSVNNLETAICMRVIHRDKRFEDIFRYVCAYMYICRDIKPQLLF